MNILILTWWRRNYMSYRQNIGTLEKLKQHCECNIYGREELQPYEEKLNDRYIELYDKHKPDVVICYSAMLLEKQGIIPFRNMNCLKICIEGDYHNMFGKEKWYRDNKFDHMILRNANDPSKIGIPSVWWPWSANYKEFYSMGNGPRKNIIGFAGSTVHRLYVIRKKARSVLLSVDLLDDKIKDIMNSERDGDIWMDQGKYQDYLRSIRGILTSTENRGPFAKTFEAMASKTTVLSSPVIHKDLLFGGKECFVEYKKDCSNIIQKAIKIRNEPEYAKTVARNGYEQFLKKHTTPKRVEELYNHINNLLKGKEVEKKWGL